MLEPHVEMSGGKLLVSMIIIQNVSFSNVPLEEMLWERCSACSRFRASAHSFQFNQTHLKNRIGGRVGF